MSLSHPHWKVSRTSASLVWEISYTEQKKKGIILVMKPFSVLVESGYMGYEILLTAIFHIRLCHNFRDQSSVKGLSRQWVEFQKVRAGRIFTTKISICVDRRYLYFSLTGKTQNLEQIRMHWNAIVSKRW